MKRPWALHPESADSIESEPIASTGEPIWGRKDRPAVFLKVREGLCRAYRGVMGVVELAFFVIRAASDFGQARCSGPHG